MQTPERAPAQADVVIIGSGIFAASIAFNLANAGVDVVLVERGEFCGEASGANVGLVTATSKPPGLLLDLGRRSIDIYSGLSQELGRFIHFEQTGSLIVATTPSGLAERQAMTDMQQLAGVDVVHLTGDEARELEPGLPASVLGASYCPTDGFVYPFAIVGAYIERAMELGASFLPHTAVEAIATHNGQVQSVTTGSGTIRTDRVVNAAGAWAGEIAGMVDLYIPITPVRGQVIVTEPIEGLPNRVILGVEPSIRNTWAANGIIGSTRERAGFEKRNRLATMREFARGLTEMFPGLGDVQVLRGWSGLRPSTPDEMPVIGESARVGGFITAGGAFRNGMLYGPAVGEAVRDLVTGVPPAFDLTPARLERFEEAEFAARERTSS